MSSIDQAVTRWINGPAGSNAVLDSIMAGTSRYGVPLLVLLVILHWWSGQDRIRLRHTCVAAGFSFLVGLGVNQIIIWFVHRVRPYDAGLSHLIVERSADWSFPSDHATATFAIAAAFLAHGRKWRGLAFLIAAVLVSVSRVYVGTHYASDVLGGTATGILAAVVVRAFYREGTAVDRFITGLL